ncbi:hypothetical protein [Acidipropionibacterium acidipropionici]|uniref:hypothetical protein n=1 Tax=Acidipropionibacterium acidipropionici TaxID=1748 RepID=UPI00110A2052|nr:hypothetical protein [Acidipropionibacterium acidipropionici]QCV96494.1 hypothetical protein FEZ30_15665 [Acidipropionibacterium acidipropionici]
MSVATPAVVAPVVTAAGPRVTGLKRLGRKGLIGIIAGVLVLALGIGGGVWFGTRQPTLDPVDVGRIFSPSIMGVGNADYGSEGSQFTGSELRSRFLDQGSISHSDCVETLRSASYDIDRIQGLGGTGRAQGESGSDAKKRAEILKHPYSYSIYAYAGVFSDSGAAKSAMRISSITKSCATEYLIDGERWNLRLESEASGRVSRASWASYFASLSGENETGYLGGCLFRYGNVAVGTYTYLGGPDDWKGDLPKASQIDCKSFAEKVADRIDQLT